jgi:hypothetical protein
VRAPWTPSRPPPTGRRLLRREWDSPSFLFDIALEYLVTLLSLPFPFFSSTE